MGQELEQEVVKVAKASISTAIEKTLLEGFDSPLKKLISETIMSRETEFKRLVSKSIDGLLSSDAFRHTFKQSLHQKIAKQLISKTGGEIEKTINRFRQDETTRARITLALDSLISDLLMEKPV